MRMSMRGVCVLVVAGTVLMAADRALAKGAAAETNLLEALTKAKTENKLLFVQYGREACGNCQALKAMIRKREVNLSDADFVYADVNCDDPDTRQVFGNRFTVEGRMLPFVVIADPEGKQLAARSGYGEAGEFEDFIRDAKRAYEKAHKAQPAPKPTLSPPKPTPATPGIPADANREIRSWTSVSGQQVTAAVVEKRAGVVVLRKEDGSKIQIRVASLSRADRDYLDGLREAAAKTTGP
jgi:thioredoxin-related protein